jgi:hypothetical protein
MPKTKTASKAKSQTRATASNNFDGVYFLKLVLYLFLGSLWIKVSHGGTIGVGIPVGLIIGLVFTTHEHFQIDRKIEYAVLIVAMLFGYFVSYGLYINF